MTKTAGWCVFAGYFALLLAWGGQPDARGHLAAASGIMIAAGIGVMVLGWRGALTFLAIALAVTLTIENIGVATGLPFGRYHFQETEFTVWIGRVPLLVPMLYFGVGLLCWLIAGVLRDGRFARPVIAAGLMVLWDLMMDPGFSTIGRVWVWHEGGAFFGVPVLNFAGWFVTTWIMFQLFALTAPGEGGPRDLKAIAILLYMGIGLTPVVPFLIRADAAVTDAAGQVWHTHEIWRAAMVAGLCMCAAGLAALRKLARASRF